jgi:molybdopterin converting factor small subunit
MNASGRKKLALEVRVFGFLRKYMDENNLGYVLERNIPETGSTAGKVAESVFLPLEKIEAVFCNGRVVSLDTPVHAGDRVAFFPHGTPGPYRVFLGMVRENLKRGQQENEKRGEP